MTIVDTQFSGVRDAFEKASSGYGYGVKSSARSDSSVKSTPEATQHDAIHDTVSLSAGGEKIVNLNRGQELSQQIKNAPVDKDFAENLRKSTEDVFRITKLFTQTVKSAFSWLR
ncbi:hypothetical protein [Magnetovibrio blakemorei]|uniref:Uncharacterized protein n=1 Tax=Magnetovibrio blakemorei TaxID=28181 RepID=A0A1E5Q4M7_9PROT|nr:hypothetical protein [Magnetovibrio blakemorei]OEJ64681.1 hypothetical protein BEN30_00900 [Magnetovibrio blakemorei]